MDLQIIIIYVFYDHPQVKMIQAEMMASSLDHETGALVMELFREEVLKKNRALIIVTHDQRIFPYADRIIRIEDGQIVQT